MPDQASPGPGLDGRASLGILAMYVTRYDRALAKQCGALLVFCAAATWTIMVMTDEAVSTPAMRGARLAATAPGLAVLAVLTVDAVSRSRGECLALESLGLSPTRRLLGAVVTTWVFSALACLLLLLPFSDVRALFPLIIETPSWAIDESGFSLTSAGVSVAQDRWPTLSGGRAMTSEPPLVLPGRSAAIALTLPLAIVAPLWAAIPARAVTRVWLGALTAGACVLALHAVAAGRVPYWAGACASVPFLTHLIAARATAT